MASSNSIDCNARGTDFRMYDVKLAIGCAGGGYDYIWKQTNFLKSSESNNSNILLAAAKTAKAYAIQLDKTGTLAIADAFFSAFLEDSESQIDKVSIYSWPSNYDEHYQSMMHGKEQNSMVRAIRIDTDGHLLKEESDSIYIESEIVDRDYANSSLNVSLTKTIKYAFSYNLRSRNFYLLWLFNGDDRGDIEHESSKTYVK